MEDSGPTTLEHLLNSKYITTDTEWLRVLLVMAQRMDELHRAGYVHTDFHKGNAIVKLDPDQEPDVHVIDFGLTVRTGERPLMPFPKTWWVELLLYRHCAWETAKGMAVSPATDVVGYAEIVS